MTIIFPSMIQLCNCKRRRRWTGGPVLIGLLILIMLTSAMNARIPDAELEQQIQPEVDRPVPVKEIHVLAGDRVELPCDVSSWDPDAPDPSIAPRRIHQHRQASSSSSSSSSSIRRGSSSSQEGVIAAGLRHYSGWSSSSAGSGRLHGRFRRRYGRHNEGHDSDEDEEEKEGGYLVLWFIDPERKPFYSYDERKGKTGRHWWDEQRFDKRVRFLLPWKSGGGGGGHQQLVTTASSVAAGLQSALLQIGDVTRQDAGDYRCRIDFNNAPSRNFKYRLFVIDPPTSVVILDGLQQQLSIVAGPLDEGNDLFLTCKAYGGYPTPWVTWWKGGQLLDNITDERTPQYVSNRLIVDRISRHNLHDAFTCQVTSSPFLAPIMKTVTLELNLRPLSIEIILPNALEMNRSRPLMVVAEQSVEVKCRTFGSRPAPSITWWKGNKQIPSQLSAISNADDGNVTLSRLLLSPKSEDDGSHLTCRVKNSMIAGAVLEESIKLDIQYPPEVGIALGSNINGDDVKEGDDLYIECHIRANPAFYKLQWTHNGVALVHNVSAGVVLSNVSLVLRSVTHARAGSYACSAANTRGETTSHPPLQLRVQYAPRCHSVSAAGTVSGVSKQETASLDCQVDADPSNDVHFWWTFLGTPMKSNGSSLLTSSNDAILLSRSLFTSKGSTSVLQYSPKSELDFGVVACWASNPVGNQREPCLFHVVPAGKPTAPSNCAIHNQTADSVRVDCQEAFDGGLQQTFGLELVDRETRTLRYVFNNTKPVFTVYGLEPETAFLLNIYALNAKGRSQPIVLETTTLRAAQKHTGHALYFQMTPLLGVLVGTAGTLLAIVLAVAIVVHRRNKLKRQRQSTQQQQQSQRPQEPPPSAGQGGAQQPLLSEGASPAAPPSQRSVSVTTKSSSNNGHAIHQNHFGTMTKVNGPVVNQEMDHHYTKDPDIILRDMDFLQMKRTLPAVMKNGNINHQQSANNTLVMNKTLRRGLEDGSAGSPASVNTDDLFFRPESSSSSSHRTQPHPDRSGSSNSWNISPCGGGGAGLINQMPHGWSSTSPFGGVVNNGGLMMHSAAADLLADCRLPESSL